MIVGLLQWGISKLDAAKHRVEQAPLSFLAFLQQPSRDELCDSGIFRP